MKNHIKRLFMRESISGKILVEKAMNKLNSNKLAGEALMNVQRLNSTKIGLMFLCVFSLSLTGCNEQANKQPSSSSNGAIKQAAISETEYKDSIEKFQPLSPNKNYANNISGDWLWVIKKDNTTMNRGRFTFLEKEGVIRGTTYSIAPIKSTQGAGKSNISLLALPLNGERKSENAVSFTLKHQGQIVVNEGNILSEGKEMKGTTQVSGKDEVYTWEARRVSGGLSS